jgi:hypothetical protein
MPRRDPEAPGVTGPARSEATGTDADVQWRLPAVVTPGASSPPEVSPDPHGSFQVPRTQPREAQASVAASLLTSRSAHLIQLRTLPPGGGRVRVGLAVFKTVARPASWSRVGSTPMHLRQPK